MKTKLNIRRRINEIIVSIEQRSQMPIENVGLIKRYLRESLISGKKITFYDWECPPRFLDRDRDGRLFVNYDVNLKSIFRGGRVDRFTELPKVVEYKQQEKRNLQFLLDLGIRFRFVKLIADTNLFYLTPESLAIGRAAELEEKMCEFRLRVKDEMKDYPGNPEVYRFTKLMRKYVEEYDQNFKYALNILQSSPDKLISKSAFLGQLRRTREHVGWQSKKEVLRFSLKTIATYAAEGVVFGKLSAGALPNCVWLNPYEADRRTVEITNCLRRKRGLPDLPIIFPYQS
ncbi:MAG: hypothetical protein AAB686_02575 [Patescibacteria group bacterium]